MGLKMNIAQTKVMVVDNTPINVNNVLIENVQGYVYLGQGRAYLPPQRRKKMSFHLFFAIVFRSGVPLITLRTAGALTDLQLPATASNE